MPLTIPSGLSSASRNCSPGLSPGSALPPTPHQWFQTPDAFGISWVHFKSFQPRALNPKLPRLLLWHPLDQPTILSSSITSPVTKSLWHVLLSPHPHWHPSSTNLCPRPALSLFPLLSGVSSLQVGTEAAGRPGFELLSHPEVSSPPDYPVKLDPMVSPRQTKRGY